MCERAKFAPHVIVSVAMMFASTERSGCTKWKKGSRSLPTISLMIYCQSWRKIVMIFQGMILSSRGHTLPKFQWQWAPSSLNLLSFKPTRLSHVLGLTFEPWSKNPTSWVRSIGTLPSWRSLCILSGIICQIKSILKSVHAELSQITGRIMRIYFETRLIHGLSASRPINKVHTFVCELRILIWAVVSLVCSR